MTAHGSPRPQAFHAGGLAGIARPGGDGFTIVFLHAPGGDLESVRAVMEGPGLSGIALLALDLPGHGLSDDCHAEAVDAMLADGLARFAQDCPGPFLPVGFGASAALAHRLAGLVPVFALAVVAPEDAEPGRHEPALRIPLLGIRSGVDAGSTAAWERFRKSAALPWTALSLALPPDMLRAPDPATGRIIASHLGGFARDAFHHRRLA